MISNGRDYILFTLPYPEGLEYCAVAAQRNRHRMMSGKHLALEQEKFNRIAGFNGENQKTINQG